MKKYLSFVMAGIMALSLTACGSSESSSKKDDSKPSQSEEKTSQKEEKPASDGGNNTADVNPVELSFFPKTSPDAGAYATIKILPEVKMDDESAWLGLCPAGKNYITEIEADESDIIYFYYDYREAGDPYVYSCDFSSVDDGKYALVVCTSDDENVGYVAIQLEMTKKGEELSFDYSNAEIKERPAK